MGKKVKFAGVTAAGIGISPAQTLSEPLNNMYPMHLDREENGALNIGVETVSPYDPATGKATMPVTIQDLSGIKLYFPTYGDQLVFATKVVPVNSLTSLLNLTSTTSELLRTPTVFKTISANAIGSTALWTPTAGKKFRVMGYTFTLPSTATSAAGTTITLMDAAAAVFTLIVMGTTSGALACSVPLSGNGYLSTAVNNVLNINCSAALTLGFIGVSVWGTEE